jgi:hypothetical protein
MKNLCIENKYGNGKRKICHRSALFSLLLCLDVIAYFDAAGK